MMTTCDGLTGGRHGRFFCLQAKLEKRSPAGHWRRAAISKSGINYLMII